MVKEQIKVIFRHRKGIHCYLCLSEVTINKSAAWSYGREMWFLEAYAQVESLFP